MDNYHETAMEAKEASTPKKANSPKNLTAHIPGPRRKPKYEPQIRVEDVAVATAEAESEDEHLENDAEEDL